MIESAVSWAGANPLEFVGLMVLLALVPIWLITPSVRDKLRHDHPRC